MEFVHPSSIRDDVFRKTKLATINPLIAMIDKYW